MNKTMKVFDMETIVICAVMAVIGTFGLVAGGAAFAGIRFQECNRAALAGLIFGLSGLLWGILLISAGRQRTKNI